MSDKAIDAKVEDNNKDKKTRYWVAVLYPENMAPDWQNDIDDVLQVPYAYCVHDKDVCEDGSPRKTHVHCIIVFPNTTTYKHALETFQKLTAPGQPKCANTCEAITGIRHMYDYLIHDTAGARKKGKHLYDASERIEGNNFDIGAFEQLSIEQKNDMALELCMDIREQGFVNFADFFDYVLGSYDKTYFEIVRTYSGLFERLTKGNYQKRQDEAERQGRQSSGSTLRQERTGSEEDEEQAPKSSGVSDESAPGNA